MGLERLGLAITSVKAIAREETFFNNIFQIGGGTGVGFGQVEPAEFYKLKNYGLNLPTISQKMTNAEGKTWTKTYSARPLTDKESVKASAALLAELHNRLGSVQGALEGYGGVSWARQNKAIAKPTADERLAIIAGWRECAKKLEPCRPFRKPTRAEEDEIMDGLQFAKAFRLRREEFRPILFPAQDYK